MKALVEGTLFLGVATALHVALWQGLPADSAEGAGEGGSASMTVGGADAVLAATVAEWDAPPTTTQNAASPITPLASQSPATPAPGPLPRRSAAPSSSLPALSSPPQEEAFAPAPPPPAPEPAPTTLAPADSPRPTARPAPPPPASPVQAAPARRAEGAGAGGTRGSRAVTEAAGQGAAARQTALAEWGGRIRARIDRARPRTTGRGAVTLSLTVARDGRLLGASVVAGSGQPALDRAALRAVTGAGRFPEAPAALQADRYSFRLPVRFD
jgi:periplasmic protein TonB